MKNLNDLPRIPLGLYPTPFYRLESVSARYGKAVWIKRDDLCGVALGGNKVRKLEFLLAEARGRGCDTVITTGGAQSNHAMLTAACAARLEMHTVLVLQKRGATEHLGNLILDDLYGAEVVLIDTDSHEALDSEMSRRAAELEAQGHRCCIIPLGGSTALGSVGYVSCARELTVQTLAAGISLSHIVCAVGSGGTAAGLLLGARLFQPRAKVTGIAVSDAPFDWLVPSLAAETAELLNCAPGRTADDFEIAPNIGPGYAVPNPQDTPYIQWLARSEGILLDPVYTGKAFAGMCRLLETGYFDGTDNIVFVHTGGAAALFAIPLA